MTIALKCIKQLVDISDIESPERNLLAEVLARAIRDIVNPLSDGESQKNARCACSWVLEASDMPFGYKWVCRELDLDPDKIKYFIFEQKKTGIYFSLDINKRNMRVKKLTRIP